MQIARSKTRDNYPLSLKKITKKTLKGSLYAVTLFLIVYPLGLVALWSAWGNFSYWLSIASVAFLASVSLSTPLIYIYQKWYYAVYFYDFTDDFVIIKKGVFAPREITIPYERIQDIYVDQDVIDRIFGLYDVHVSSATISSGMEAHIDGVEKTAADGLRQILIDTVQRKMRRQRSANAGDANSQIKP